MKKNIFILIFCFSSLIFHAQVKRDSCKLKFTPDPYSIFQPSLPGQGSLYKNNGAPKLPFFCGMEDQFRNKFNIYLKIRTGNDESYMKMIKPTK